MRGRRKAVKGKWIGVVLALGILAVVSVAAVVDVVPVSKGLTVHEWGTFTSVAGPEGQAVEWLPVDRQSDLPCFVNQDLANLKDYLFATVRMETPVLYFYTSRDMRINATVRFPKGWITEWYPQAELSNEYIWEEDKTTTLEWRDVQVSPNANPNFPVEPGPSHYYPARQTDATPLRVRDQSEKFLFYRGIGNFPVPISAKVKDDGKILLWSSGKAPIPGVILFERRGTKMGYRVLGSLAGAVAMTPPTLNGDLVSLQRELERILVTTGLYPKEAAAMVATWRDSWFEEGTRVFYIVPPGSVDANLPLNIQPKPVSIARAFVGRMEIITATTERTVAVAIRTNDRPVLKTYARFLRPIAERLAEKNAANHEERSRFLDLATVVFGDETDEKYRGACKR
jgi:hypothetical protein